MSLNGVYGFLQRKVVVSELDEIALSGRVVRIAFDSDVMTNPSVMDALSRLAGAITRRGGRVEMVQLPEGEDARKVGLDDFFAAGGKPVDLDHLTKAWSPVSRPHNLVESEDPIAKIDRLQQLVSAQAALIRNPDLKDKQRALGFSVITLASSAVSKGDAGADGRPRLSAAEIANDYRPRPPKGTPLDETNRDGTRPLTKRSDVKAIIVSLVEAGIFEVSFEQVERRHPNGDRYRDTEYPVTIDDPVSAIRRLADFRRPTARKAYTRHGPCPACGELHAETVIRSTVCGSEEDAGCGEILAETRRVICAPPDTAADQSNDELTE